MARLLGRLVKRVLGALLMASILLLNRPPVPNPAPAPRQQEPAPAQSKPAQVPAPETPKPQGALSVISGYTVTAFWQDRSSLNDLKARGAQVTDVATVSHRFTADGQITGVLQTETLATAQAMGKRRWLVIQNLDANYAFSAALAEGLLDRSGAQARFIGGALALLRAHGYTGLELDLEGISPAYRAKYTAFLQKVKAALAPAGFPLAVAIPAKTWDDPQNRWSAAYDYRAIGQTADRITLMTYDEHWQGDPPGPIASLPWVEGVLTYATAVMPPQKILMGVAGYGYSWPITGGMAKSVGAAAAAEIARRGTYRWDAAAGSPSVQYRDDQGVARILWYENEESLRLKLALAKRYGVAGIALWRMGLEGDALWRALQAR
jgi:spore germination protein